MAAEAETEAENVGMAENLKKDRRSSDEVPDAIDKVEDETRTSHKDSQDIVRKKDEFPGVSVYGEARESRENSPDISHCTKVTGFKISDESDSSNSRCPGERVEEYPG